MTGRWPANVILSPEMAEALDEQSGILKSGDLKPYRNASEAEYTQVHIAERNVERKGDSGGASRFFLTAGYEPWELEWIIANGLTPCGT